MVCRRSRKKHPGTYLQTAGSEQSIAESRVVDSSEILLEFLMNALRLRAGIDISLAAARTGLSSQDIRNKLENRVSKNLLVESKTRITCSEKGYLFIDEILEQLL